MEKKFKSIINWDCPVCHHRFTVLEMRLTKFNKCPTCSTSLIKQTVDYDNSSVGKRLKKIRHDMRLTQIKFANLVRKTQLCISNYEYGRSSTPVSVLVILGNMNYNLNWLVTGIGEMRR